MGVTSLSHAGSACPRYEGLEPSNPYRFKGLSKGAKKLGGMTCVPTSQGNTSHNSCNNNDTIIYHYNMILEQIE